jgi:subtilisin family serine protease
MRRIAVGAVVLAGVVVVSARPPIEEGGQAQVEQVDGRRAAAGEVLVKLRAQTPARDVDELSRLADADAIRPIGRSGVRRVRSRVHGTRALIDRLSGHPAVVYAEPNYIVTALVGPPDPFVPYLWGLENVGQAVNGGVAGAAGADIHATEAWDVSFGSRAHVVAVIDTGIDYTHPDLADNTWSAPAPFTVTIDGVAVTCPAGSHGFNTLTRSCNPMDDHDHGTHVAGTIGATAGNGIGVAGVNWVASIMGLKFLDETGSGTIAGAIESIDFAIQARDAFAATGGADVRVLSNSWGGRDFSQALADEIAVANEEGMLFVAAAGNDGFSNDLLPLYPASYDVPNVIAVAATTNTDARAWFSNYGAVSVDLGAPGADIFSTAIGNRYVFNSGTSMATPHVSGAAMLVLSRCDLDTAALKNALLATVEPVGALAEVTATGGRLDVNSAIRSCLGPPATPSNLTAAAGDGRVTLTWTRVPGATGVNVKRSLAAGGPYTAVTTGATGAAYVDTSVVNDTTYFYKVSATNPQGESADSSEVSATPKAPSDLMISSLTLPTVGGAGGTVVVTETTKNQGAGRSLATTTRYFLSRNTLLDASDTLLEPGHVVPGLLAGGVSTASTTVAIPSSTEAGQYFVLAKADADGVETETSEFNNVAARLLNVGPDLAVSSLTAPATAGAGASIAVTDVIRNQGGGSAGSSTTRFYLSVNATFDAGDTPLSGARSVGALVSGGTSTGTSTVVVPAATPTGSYYLLARADADGTVLESQETNNTTTRLVTVGGDLTVAALTAPARAAAGAPIAIASTTSNPGSSAVGASTTRFYLSANTMLDDSDAVLAGSHVVGALAAGASSSSTTTVNMPSGLTTGTYFVLARADADGVVVETSESNNVMARAVAVGPDLGIASVSATPFEVARGAVLTVGDTVQNHGASPAEPSVTRFYLSTDLLLDPGDVPIGTGRAVPTLAASATSTGSTVLTIPVSTAPGPYYLFAKADGNGSVTETQEGNNVAARAIKVIAP